MTKRLCGVALLAAVLAALSLGTAWAVEEGEEEGEEHRELPSIEEVGTRSETALEHYPEPYTAPTVFRAMALPLLVVGAVVFAGWLLLYLVWQPRFAQERRSGKRR